MEAALLICAKLSNRKASPQFAVEICMVQVMAETTCELQMHVAGKGWLLRLADDVAMQTCCWLLAGQLLSFRFT